jgi:DNA (cytosine-5)-methyltransferase 1
MCALIQGFPQDWVISGKKTPAYRQVGNAFPTPVARAVARAIAAALIASDKSKASTNRATHTTER